MKFNKFLEAVAFAFEYSNTSDEFSFEEKKKEFQRKHSLKVKR